MRVPTYKWMQGYYCEEDDDELLSETKLISFTKKTEVQCWKITIEKLYQEMCIKQNFQLHPLEIAVFFFNNYGVFCNIFCLEILLKFPVSVIIIVIALSPKNTFIATQQYYGSYILYPDHVIE